MALKDAIEASVVKLLNGIVTRFSVPSTIISNNAKYFVGAHICSWDLEYGIYLSTSSNYYAQGNGLVVSSNKNLIRIMRRIIKEN